jgi:hypothetical protein
MTLSAIPSKPASKFSAELPASPAMEIARRLERADPLYRKIVGGQACFARNPAIVQLAQLF